MPLLSREELAKGFLESAETHFQAQVGRLQADIDNLLANSVGIDDHQRIDNALVDLFEKIAAETDSLQAVKDFRQKRNI